MSDSTGKFKNVFWLGGSPCAGKSSISEILSNHFDIDVYHVDEAFDVHAKRFDPILHPTLSKWCGSTWNDRWMQPVEGLVQEAIACYREHFSLVLEDILSMPDEKPLLIEGTALLPKQVAGLIPTRSRAMWVVPTADFQARHYGQREWVAGILEQCDDSVAAFRNWMARDAEFAKWVTAEVNALGLGLLQVDGIRMIEENAMAVATHFQLDLD